ncbi:hypothetical protein H0H92_009909 [Tricholoma furcatifolium]|nr:hypothetical protein H0H92_009909 [Tricholoma furcatifolium]
MEPSTSQPLMIKVTPEMLANTPYATPTGCPINTLPTELLVHIFTFGMQMELEDEDDDDDDDDFPGELDGLSTGLEVAQADEKVDSVIKVEFLPPMGESNFEVDAVSMDGETDYGEDDPPALQFQVLVSHVCRQWRQVALGAPTLWTSLDFLEGSPFEKSKIWIERANGSPLDIRLDCAVHEDEDDDHEDFGYESEASQPPGIPSVNPAEYSSQYVADHQNCVHPPPSLSLQNLTDIMDILVPVVAQWRSFEITTGYWEYTHRVLTRLAQCPRAPLLETLGFYHYEELDNYDVFEPADLKGPFRLFQGEAPNLRNIALWGVHLDWDRSLGLLSNLDDLELTYHPEDVRPSYETFVQMMKASPNLRTLSLSQSGPQVHDAENNNWGSSDNIISIPSLTGFVFALHTSSYAIALLERLSLTNVDSLALDFSDEDFTEFANKLCEPMPGTSLSLLAGLRHLKISSLPCNKTVAKRMLMQLVNLKSFNINCSNYEEKEMFMLLLPQKTTTGSSASAQQFLCPSLESITTTAINGEDMRAFVKARNTEEAQNKGVAEIRVVMMSDEDHVDEDDLKWLRNNVKFDFFEGSDEEEFEDEFDDDEFSEDEDVVMSDG